MDNAYHITFKHASSAKKCAESGLLAFNLSMPGSNIRQEECFNIVCCMRCYQLEDHATRECRKPKEYQICSECAQVGHIWKNCTSTAKKSVNCSGDHRTLAMKCQLLNLEEILFCSFQVKILQTIKFLSLAHLIIMILLGVVTRIYFYF